MKTITNILLTIFSGLWVTLAVVLAFGTVLGTLFYILSTNIGFIIIMSALVLGMFYCIGEVARRFKKYNEENQD